MHSQNNIPPKLFITTSVITGIFIAITTHNTDSRILKLILPSAV
jgi:hypothetical protein